MFCELVGLFVGLLEFQWYWDKIVQWCLLLVDYIVWWFEGCGELCDDFIQVVWVGLVNVVVCFDVKIGLDFVFFVVFIIMGEV